MLRQNQLSGFGARRVSAGDPWWGYTYVGNPLIRDDVIRRESPPAVDLYAFPVTASVVRNSVDGYWPITGAGLQVYYNSLDFSNASKNLMFNRKDGVVEMYYMRTGAYTANPTTVLIGGRFHVTWDSGTSMLHLFDTEVDVASASHPDPFPLNTLVHVAIAKDQVEDTTKVYIDGNLVLARNSVGTGVFSDAAIWMLDRGWNSGQTGPNCNGRYYGGRLTERHPDLGIRYSGASFTPPSLPFPETL